MQASSRYRCLFVFVERVGVALSERVKRGPRLSSRRDVLPLILTDHAVSGRLLALGMLRAAGSADVEGHYFVFLGFGRPYFGRAAHPRR